MNKSKNFAGPESREGTRILKQLNDDYLAFLVSKRAVKSPPNAHQFALIARHSGTTYGRTVAEIIVELEGELPIYWEQT